MSTGPTATNGQPASGALLTRAEHVIPGGMWGHQHNRFSTPDHPMFVESSTGAHGTAAYSGPVTMPYVTFGDDDHAIVSAFSRVCLREGLFLHPRHNWFLSAAHDDDVIDRALSATAVAFSEIDPLREQSSTRTTTEERSHP
jgi:glutamate-1-semialdehyde aminotransferase